MALRVGAFASSLVGSVGRCRCSETKFVSFAGIKIHRVPSVTMLCMHRPDSMRPYPLPPHSSPLTAFDTLSAKYSTLLSFNAAIEMRPSRVR